MKKTILAALVSIATITSSPTAKAEQYSLYVSHADRVNPLQAQLSSMIQSNILIDTTTRTVRLTLSPACHQALCPEVLQTVLFKLTSVKKVGAQIVNAKAEGMLTINGKASATRVEITQNLNNATSIQITSAATPWAAVSTFVGSPTELSNVLF